MKVCSSVEALYKEIEKEVVKALDKEAIKIKKAMEDYINNEIYGSYEPSVYHRMNEFLNSATIEPTQNVGGEWYVEIYIPDTVHSVSNIPWEGGEKTLSGIADYFARGEGYGRDGKKYDVVKEVTQEYISDGKAFQEIVAYLRKNFDVIK